MGVHSPVVSVVIAAHNEESMIGTAIRSVANQTFESLELIIVDDGSTDCTADVVESWSQRDRRVRLIRNTANAGQTISLNRGIKEARGEWIARLDGDDTWYPERLEAQLEYAGRLPDVGLLGAWAYGTNQQTGRKSLLRTPESDGEIRKALWRFCPFIHSTVLIRRRLLSTNGGYNPKYKCAQDYELWFRLVFQTRCYNVPVALCSRLTHREQSLTYCRWKEIEREAFHIRLKNMRLRNRGLSTYLTLLPCLGKLCLPTAAKRWKQSLVRPWIGLAAEDMEDG